MSLNPVFSKALCCVLKIYVKKPKFRKEFLEKNLFHIIIILYEIYVIILNVTNNNYVSIIFSVRGRKPERGERIGGRERKGDKDGRERGLTGQALFSMVTAPIYIFTSSVWGFLFLHALTNICCLWFLKKLKIELSDDPAVLLLSI